MQPMKVYVDFQNADPQALRLNAAGTLCDLSLQHIALRTGLQLMLYCDDLTDAGEPDELRALGDVEYSTEEQIWVARIDWSAIRRASEAAVETLKLAGGETQVG